MKKLTFILTILILSSCNPFISKDVRKDKRANRKLERLVKKFPDLLKKDTILVDVEVPKIEIDSVIIVERDTTWLSEIKNDTIREVIRQKILKYVPLKDTIVHIIDGITFTFFNKNGNIGYSVRKPQEIIKKQVDVQTVTPIETKDNNYLWIIILILILILTIILWTKR